MRLCNFYIPIFICCLFLLVSCNEKDDEGLIGPEVGDLEIVEIIDPPDIPGIYTQGLIQPKVKIRNNWTYGMSYIYVSYMIMTLDSIRQFGPGTSIDTLGPSEELIINLSKWDKTPLSDGTYWIYVFIDQPQGGFDSPWNKKKKFILEL